MFAPSYKKGIVNKRGRFNVGEKFALAMFDYANIKSTTGSIIFKKDGTRQKKMRTNETGTIFSGMLKCRSDEIVDFIEKSFSIIPPENVEFIVNKDLKLIDQRFTNLLLRTCLLLFLMMRVI